MGANRVSAGEAVRRPANPLYVGSSHTDLRRGPLFQFPEKNACQATRWKRHPKPRSHRLLTLVVAGTLPSPCQAGTIFFPQLGQTTLPHSEPVCGRWGDTNNDKAEVRGAGSFLAVWRCTGLLGNYIQNVKRPPRCSRQWPHSAFFPREGGEAVHSPRQAALRRERQQGVPLFSVSDTPGRHLRHLMRSADALLAQTQRRRHPAD